MKAIELKNVKKNFKDGDETIEALKETNFSVDKGEFVAIIGPSGSGRALFLLLLVDCKVLLLEKFGLTVRL